MKISWKIMHLLMIGILPVWFSGCKKTPKPNPPPPTVTTAPAVQRDVPIYVDAIGQAIPPVTVQIRPQVAGKLISAFIKQGAIVKEGDILYVIDSRPYEAILDQAKAQLEHDKALLEYADVTVKRYKPVVEEDFIALWTFDQYLSNASAARAQVESDEAAVRAAQINVDYCNIVAPVAGKISSFAVDVGNILAVDDPTAITALRPFSPIDVQFSLPQQHFEMIRRVQGDSGEWAFTAILPEDPDSPFEGKTYFVDNQIDQDTGTIFFKGRLPNVNRELWPGEFIKVQVLYKEAKNAIVVKPGAILMGKNGPYLYTVDKEGKAQAHNVTVLTRTNDYIALESKEIHGGDTIIIDGQVNIAPGLIVNAKLETPTAAANKK